MGNVKRRKRGVMLIPSSTQKTMKTPRDKPKFIRDETFLENKNKYFGTFILVKIPEFARREPIPPPVESLKKEKTMFPQKRYIT